MDNESASPGADQIIARNLRAHRAAAQMTLRGLAEKTGISPPVLMRLEKGARPVTINQGLRIADALGIPFEKLLEN